MTEAIIGLVGVVVGSVITLSKDLWTSWRERRREGSYSAMRLVSILEEYADKCIDVVCDNGTVCGQPAGRTESGEEYYEAQVREPDPLVFPDDIVWRSLPAPLMHRTLDLPNAARSTNRYISACSERASPPDYGEFFEARQQGYARLSLDAFELADDLRKQFSIAKKSRASLTTDWDPVSFLREKISTFEKKGG